MRLWRMEARPWTDYSVSRRRQSRTSQEPVGDTGCHAYANDDVGLGGQVRQPMQRKREKKRERERELKREQAQVKRKEESESEKVQQ